MSKQNHIHKTNTHSSQLHTNKQICFFNRFDCNNMHGLHEFLHERQQTKITHSMPAIPVTSQNSKSELCHSCEVLFGLAKAKAKPKAITKFALNPPTSNATQTFEALPCQSCTKSIYLLQLNQAEHKLSCTEF